jgi:hypothetical protein
MISMQEPNWLIVIGFVYIAYAFGLLALAAVQKDFSGDATSRHVADAKQRACFTFAGIAGMLGAGMQVLGQGVYVGRDLSVVMILLGLVVLLLGYLAFSERMATASRARVAERRTELAVVARAGTGTGAYGQAAE